MRLHRHLPFLLPAALLTLSACGRDAGAASSWAGTIDTLAGGRVRVTSPEQGAWREGEGWKLVEEMRIGTADEEGPTMFGSLADLEVDALGRIWVADGMANEIRIFGPDGRHVRTVGRKGGGPGEFEQIAGLDRDPAGRIWVYDPRNARFSVLDTAGTLVTSHRRDQGFMMVPWRGGFDASGRLYDPSAVREGEEFTPVMMRYDSAMSPVDTLKLPRYESAQFELRGEGTRMAASVPFTPGLFWRLSRAGGLWMGITDKYEVHHVTLAGDTTRTISRPFTPTPVTQAEKDEELGRMEWFTRQGGKVDAGRIPAVKPAYGGLFEDEDGYLWITPYLPKDAPRTYDLFDPEGRYLGRVDVPGEDASLRLSVIRGPSVYGIARDADDVEYVVRYRIEGRR
jgi:hypothetical protein